MMFGTCRGFKRVVSSVHDGLTPDYGCYEPPTRFLVLKYPYVVRYGPTRCEPCPPGSYIQSSSDSSLTCLTCPSGARCRRGYYSECPSIMCIDILSSYGSVPHCTAPRSPSALLSYVSIYHSSMYRCPIVLWIDPPSSYAATPHYAATIQCTCQNPLCCYNTPGTKTRCAGTVNPVLKPVMLQPGTRLSLTWSSYPSCSPSARLPLPLRRARPHRTLRRARRTRVATLRRAHQTRSLRRARQTLRTLRRAC